MTDAQRIGKAERTPSTGDMLGSTSQSSLPTDFLQRGSQRLGYACLFYAFGYVAAYGGPVLSHTLREGEVPEYALGFKSIVALGAILSALALYVLIRSRKIRPARLLDLGLVFEVVGAFGITMTATYGAYPEWSKELLLRVNYAGIPWECSWIMIFPLLTPGSPPKILISSLAAASMGLVTMAISKATGATSPDVPWPWLLTYYLFTTYLCAILAYLVSRWIRQFGVQIKRAREIGQYRLIESLGEGGMGQVWRARHRMLARPAAIKLIRPEALGADQATRDMVLRRFEREARATARLRSMHTISIYDFGITEQGSFYYVMELLDGMDLNTLVRRFGPIPAGRTIHLLRQACHSLMDAHDNGMIHRDIKPANIYVCRLGPDHDFVKVLDFGLVKSDRTGSSDATELTREGITVGTPGYMPPEMAMGATKIDGRADLYALGCVGYWLLTGQPVFEADTPLATVLHHVKTEPVPPSQRTEIEMPADLEKTILSCLSKDPADRPPSARDLDGLLAGCETSDTWTTTQAEQWWTLHMPKTVVEESEDELSTMDGALVGKL